MTQQEKPTPKTQFIQPTSIASVAMVGTLSVRMRSVLSIGYLRAACHFAQLSQEIEDANTGRPWGELEEINGEHRAYVIGAISSAAALIEATINEMFSDATDNRDRLVAEIGTQPTDKMAEAWARWNWPNRPPKTLSKYQVAQEAVGATQFTEQDQLFGDADALLKLRNKLLHYSPEWLPAGEQSPHRIEQKLSGKFKINQLMPANSQNPFFPDKCLGCGCARWATLAAVAFLDEFHRSIGLTPRYERFRSKVDSL